MLSCRHVIRLELDSCLESLICRWEYSILCVYLSLEKDIFAVRAVEIVVTVKWIKQPAPYTNISPPLHNISMVNYRE